MSVKRGVKIMVEHEKEIMKTKGFGWRVSLSIIIGIGWLVFLVLWLFFYATNYTFYQNIAIVLLSLLVVGFILGVPWMFWGMKFRTEQEKEMWKTQGFRWRAWLSGILALALVIFLIYWSWYHASVYNIYQNIAIFIVSILIIMGALGASWAPWGIKYGHRFEKKRPTSYYHKKTSEEESDEEDKDTEEHKE